METITSAKNPTVQRLKALNDRKGRMANGQILVEGEVMIREALQCGLTPDTALTDEAHLGTAELLTVRGAKCYIAPESLIKSVCDTKTPQGICAAFAAPSPIGLDALPDRIVALDGVQDPGNVGTIWRTADAAGFQALLLGAGCAEALSPKVLRSAMGSGFRLPYALTDDLANAVASLRQKGYRVIAADLRGDDVYARPPLGDKLVLLVGNEAHGLSGNVLRQADVRLKLPMRGGAESLNAAVAAGIFMYELTRP